ncbi:MAG: response regulator [Desulfobacterales bacterium]|nr:response regulator [Desulfobacterales bacterium]
MIKILAIDDKEDNLITLSAVINHFIPDCIVITARSGLAGLKKAEEESPDTIILDIRMPEMDGFYVCKLLKSNFKTKHIPVILLTAVKTSSKDRIRGLDIGADAFLTKPIDESELMAQINVMLRIKKAEDILRKEKNDMEKQLIRAQKMESIGTLAGGIAHDFNNILSVIWGNAELTLNEMKESNAVYENLKDVIKACVRAKDLIQQLLCLSREKIQERKPIRISPIIKESLKMLRAAIPSSIKIKQTISDFPHMILADPGQMSQVLLNLCTNAVAAMPEGEGILEVRLENKEKYIILSVKDTGTGIDPEYIDRIFEPYFTTKEHGKGTGLGLAMVQGIVQKHDGIIMVESELGKGTIFTIHLPIIDEGFITESIQTKFILKGNNEHILIIDDESAALHILNKMLCQLGYRVSPYLDSVSALSTIRENPKLFDVVITDMTMPNMTGKTLAKEILKINPDIPIIICTGYSPWISEEDAKKIGVKALLMKPLSMEVISQTIKSLI